MVGVPPAIRAKGPISVALPVFDPDAAASLSSPATNLLKVAQTELVAFSTVGFEIQEPLSSFGDCFSRLLKSSRAETKRGWWYGDRFVCDVIEVAMASQY